MSTQTLQQFINYSSGFPYHSHWFPWQFPLGTLLCHSPSVSLIWGAVDCLVYSPLLRIQEEFILNTVQLLLGWTGDFQPPYMWNWEPGVFFSLLKIFFMKYSYRVFEWWFCVHLIINRCWSYSSILFYFSLIYFIYFDLGDPVIVFN